MPSSPPDVHGWHPSGEVRAVLGGALVAIMVVLFVVIRLDSGATARRTVSAVSLRTLPAYWVVRPRETFALIARRTGLTIAAIEDLNPRTDPGHLTVGARIVLRAHP